MKTQRPIPADDDHRVIPFRPRSALHAPQLHAPSVQAQTGRSDRLVEPLDLSRYEKPRAAPDDFRQRMLANIAAFAFTVALTAVGIWLAMSIADLRRTQDCVLMGRRDCVRISTH
ncbi:hypothetical protein [Bradyrhizobium sp. Tv2a-2]|uniref:hypothetical protein n=1 Tax=Bradyrhizobium sp. Tv2a-2 TaxID=113395 RepID=UPI000467DC85|nr:hypothetical protein [Bradyrhizobium sp. Tv2a-2]